MNFRDFDTQERKDAAADHDALPDGSFPIKSVGDLRNAVRAIGRAKDRAKAMAHIKSRAKALGAEAELPDDWKGSASMANKRVQFALAAPSRREGDYVIRQGKYFECDKEFVDMNGNPFTITMAEADERLPQYAGGNLNIEHMPTQFTEKFPGKLGKVRHVWRDGTDIMAEYSLHHLINEYFEGQPLEVSSEWNFETKMPADAALVVNPAVHDAVMMAAFAAVKCSPLMQEHHDLACRQGAECAGKAMFADAGIVLDHRAIKMMKPEELAAVQAAHDHASANGASCDLYKTKKSMYYKQSAMAALQETGAAGKGRVMSAFDKLKALFRRAGASDEEIDEGIKELTAKTDESSKNRIELGAVVNFAESTEYKAMMAQQKALLAQNETLAQGLTAQMALAAEERSQALFSRNSAAVESQVGRKLTPAAAEKWKKIAKENPAAFAATFADTIAEMPVIRQFAGARGGLHMAGPAGEGTASQQLAKMSQAKASAEKIGLDVAMAAVIEDPANAALKAAYVEECNRGVGGNN